MQKVLTKGFRELCAPLPSASRMGQRVEDMNRDLSLGAPSNGTFRVLVVSYSFPPFGEVGSIRIAQLCRYLPDCGVEPIVLSVEEDFYPRCDQTIGVPAHVRVLRTAMIPNPLDWYGKLRSRFKSQPKSPFTTPA